MSRALTRFPLAAWRSVLMDRFWLQREDITVNISLLVFISILFVDCPHTCTTTPHRTIYSVESTCLNMEMGWQPYIHNDLSSMTNLDSSVIVTCMSHGETSKFDSCGKNQQVSVCEVTPNILTLKESQPLDALSFIMYVKKRSLSDATRCFK